MVGGYSEKFAVYQQSCRLGNVISLRQNLRFCHLPLGKGGNIPPPQAVPLLTGARTLCHFVTSPYTVGSLLTGARTLCHFVTSPYTVGSHPLGKGGVGFQQSFFALLQGRVSVPSLKIKNKKSKRDGVLGCRLGRRFCFAEVSTGHPRPSHYKNNLFSAKLTGGRRDPPLPIGNIENAKPTGCQGCHPLQNII